MLQIKKPKTIKRMLSATVLSNEGVRKVGDDTPSQTPEIKTNKNPSAMSF